MRLTDQGRLFCQLDFGQAMNHQPKQSDDQQPEDESAQLLSPAASFHPKNLFPVIAAVY
jgi:hypothetical protein